jgi:hypothetical protein
VQNHLRIFDATSASGEIKTGARIRVTALAGTRGVVVEKL